MDKENKTKLSKKDMGEIVLMYISGKYYVKDICLKFGIYERDVKRIVTAYGYGY